MDQIITNMMTVLKSDHNFYEMEEAIRHLINDWVQEVFQLCFERIEKGLILDLKREGWEIDRRESRTLTTIFGELYFKRRRMRKKGEKSFLPLDVYLGLEQRTSFTPLIQGLAAKCARFGTYRQAEDLMTTLCAFSISHGTIHTMTQAVADRIKEYEDQVVFQEPEEVEDLRHPEVLFIGGDGVMVHSQEKGKHHEIHKAVLHEGVDQSHPRRPLKHPVIVTSEVSSEDLYRRVSLLLACRYRLTKSIVITNSDGGSGYEYDKFDMILGDCQRHEHFRDSFHVFQMLRRRLRFDPELYPIFSRAVSTYDWDQVLACFDTAESRLCLFETPTQLLKEELRLLYQYLERNWPYIKPMAQRFPGADWAGNGVCETTHRILTYRTKRQGRNWSLAGLQAMTRIITSLENGYFEQALKSWLPAQKPLESMIEVPKGTVRQALKRTPTRPSCGAKSGRIPNNGSTSSAMGNLSKILRV